MELKGKVPGLKLDVLDGVLVGEEKGEQGDVQGDPDHQVGDVHLKRRCSQSGFHSRVQVKICDVLNCENKQFHLKVVYF